MRTPVNGQSWEVRVIPNKFASLSSDVQPTRSLQHLRRRVAGFGFHEVIIDSPDHSRCMTLLDDSHVAKILRIYKQRHNAVRLDPPRASHHALKESRAGRGREPAAPALPVDCDAGDPKPGAAPPARSPAPL